VTVKPESAEIISGWFGGAGYEEFVRSALISAVKN